MDFPIGEFLTSETVSFTAITGKVVSVRGKSLSSPASRVKLLAVGTGSIPGKHCRVTSVTSAGTLPTDSSFVNAAFFWVKRPSGKVFRFLDETMVKPSQTFVLLFSLSG